MPGSPWKTRLKSLRLPGGRESKGGRAPFHSLLRVQVSAFLAPPAGPPPLPPPPRRVASAVAGDAPAAALRRALGLAAWGAAAAPPPAKRRRTAAGAAPPGGPGGGGLPAVLAYCRAALELLRRVGRAGRACCRRWWVC